MTAVGCDPAENPPAEPVAVATSEELAPAVRARLEALGYEPWVEENEAPKVEGVVVHDRTRAAGGFILYANRGECSAELIDRDGAVLHRWSTPPPVSGFWSDTELLADGTLLVVGGTSRSVGKQQHHRFLRRLDWNSTVLWESTFPAHHDVESLAPGRILTLSSGIRPVTYAGKERTIVDDEVVVTGGDGKPVESYSLYDAFTATEGVELARMNRRTIRVDGKKVVDIFHANSVDLVDRAGIVAENPLYAAGNILVSTRHQDTIAVLNPRDGKLVWTWGPGELQGQHSARWLASGNILVFDNGMVRRWSRVIEVDPRTNAIVWQYPGDKEHRFFTSGGGASQRLPNGNTLLTVTAKGEIFEVTSDGEVVWRYINPTRDPQKPRRATIHASTWLPADFVMPIVARQR